MLNPRGHSTYLRYDLLGRQTHTVDALGGVSYMGYDATGNRTLAQDELGNATYFFFDGLGRTTRVMDATLKSTYMGYDSRSSLVERIDADGRGTYMAYDVARRLERTSFTNPVAGEVTDTPIYYGYDQVSNLLTSDDALGGLGISTHVYDKLDRVTSKTTVAGTVAYEYDLSGMKTEVTDPNSDTTETHYDAAGRMVRATVVGSPNRDNYFHYDLSGLLEKKVLNANGVMTYHTYDVAGRLKELANLDSSAAVLTYFAYQRNPNGAITRINHEANEWTCFTFDALDRLTEEIRVKNPTLYGFEYDYDAASNRTQKVNVVSDAITDYTLDSRNLIVNEVTTEGMSEVTTAYEHDQSQRMKTRYSPALATYFSHNERGLPTKIEFAVSGGSPDTTQEFKYTGTGERAVLVSEFGTTLLAYDGTKLLTERAGGGFSFGKYRWAGRQQIEQFDGELSATLKPVMNQAGSVEKIVGLSGRVIYDKFGVELVASLPGSTRTRFMTPTLLKLGPSEMEFLLGARGCYLPGPDVLTAFGGLWFSPGGRSGGLGSNVPGGGAGRGDGNGQGRGVGSPGHQPSGKVPGSRPRPPVPVESTPPPAPPVSVPWLRPEPEVSVPDELLSHGIDGPSWAPCSVGEPTILVGDWIHDSPREWAGDLDDYSDPPGVFSEAMAIIPFAYGRTGYAIAPYGHEPGQVTKGRVFAYWFPIRDPDHMCGITALSESKVFNVTNDALDLYSVTTHDFRASIQDGGDMVPRFPQGNTQGYAETFHPGPGVTGDLGSMVAGWGIRRVASTRDLPQFDEAYAVVQLVLSSGYHPMLGAIPHRMKKTRVQVNAKVSIIDIGARRKVAEAGLENYEFREVHYLLGKPFTRVL